MKWTIKEPSCEGWYWVKLFFEFSTEKRIVHVKSLFNGSFELYFTDGESIFDVSNTSAEWAGPIPEPEE